MFLKITVYCYVESKGDIIGYTVNKGLMISCAQPGCHLPNSPGPGVIYPIPVPGRFGQKKIQESRNFFSQCTDVFSFAAENTIFTGVSAHLVSVGFSVRTLYTFLEFVLLVVRTVALSTMAMALSTDGTLHHDGGILRNVGTLHDNDTFHFQLFWHSFIYPLQ